MRGMLVGLGAIVTVLLVVVVHDLMQRQHAILRNFPIIGHFRYWLEAVGPELRQYIVTDNDEERPFSRDQRRWVYASSKHENNYFGFGTDNDLELSPNYLIIKHDAFPLPDAAPRRSRLRPAATRFRARRCSARAPAARKAFRPASVVNVSAHELRLAERAGRRGDQPRRASSPAACRTPAKAASPRTTCKGGDLVWQIGTGYFGCRDARRPLQHGAGSKDTRRARAADPRDRDQAEPGRQARPRRRAAAAPRSAAEIAEIRGIPIGPRLHQPGRAHARSATPTSMLDFVERVAERDRPAGRHQVGGRRLDVLATTWRG